MLRRGVEVTRQDQRPGGSPAELVDRPDGLHAGGLQAMIQVDGYYFHAVLRRGIYRAEQPLFFTPAQRFPQAVAGKPDETRVGQGIAAEQGIAVPMAPTKKGGVHVGLFHPKGETGLFCQIGRLVLVVGAP